MGGNWSSVTEYAVCVSERYTVLWCVLNGVSLTVACAIFSPFQGLVCNSRLCLVFQG